MHECTACTEYMWRYSKGPECVSVSCHEQQFAAGVGILSTFWESVAHSVVWNSLKRKVILVPVGTNQRKQGFGNVWSLEGRATGTEVFACCAALSSSS